MFRFDCFLESLISGISYLPKTLLLVVVPLLVGTLVGTLIALARVYRVPILGKLLAAFVTIYQGIPVVVALMIYNLLFNMKFNDIAAFLHLSVTVRDVDIIWVGIFAMTMLSIVIISDIIRGALLSVDYGQLEAGLSVGMTRWQAIRRIILPQMVPVALPGMTNAVIMLIKSSSIVMMVGICEVLMGATIPSSKTYTFFEGYLAAAVIYWLAAIVVEALSHPLNRHFARFKKIVS